MKYVTANRIREIDRQAQERFGIPSIVLMENAGIALTREILSFIERKNISIKKTAVFCGKGNNGGDGFVVARHLHCLGIKADVFVLAKSGDIKKGDPLTNLMSVRKFGITIKDLVDSKALKRLRRRFSYDLIVDAIFGTGFSGMLPVHIAQLITFLNSTELPVFAVDVPSGLDATNGKVYDACVKATVTVSFGLPKTGFLKADGPKYTGELIVRNISYPQSLLR